MILLSLYFWGVKHNRKLVSIPISNSVGLFLFLFLSLSFIEIESFCVTKTCYLLITNAPARLTFRWNFPWSLREWTNNWTKLVNRFNRQPKLSPCLLTSLPQPLITVLRTVNEFLLLVWLWPMSNYNEYWVELIDYSKSSAPRAGDSYR
jgi:hypothetical protein